MCMFCFGADVMSLYLLIKMLRCTFAHTHVPCVMVRSLPTARLHTFPLTLGGMPCHHKSLTLRDVHLHGQKRAVIYWNMVKVILHLYIRVLNCDIL